MATFHQPLLLHSPETSKHKILLLIVSVLAIISLATLFTTNSISFTNISNPLLLSQICAKAHDQASCLAMVSETASNTTMKMNDVDLLQFFLKKSSSHIEETISIANDVKHRINNPREQTGLIDCVELMELSIDRLVDSMAALRERAPNSHEDAHAWLSGVLTNHVTCLDGLEGSARILMEPRLSELITRARNFLAIFVAMSPFNTDVIRKVTRGFQFPSWVTTRDRMLLQALPKEIKANVVVAKDGSGKYKTLKEAVAAAPDNSKTRYVIYVKKGTYKENVEVGKKKKNLMIAGDGMDLTIITGHLNVVDGATTFNSATVGKDLAP